MSKEQKQLPIPGPAATDPNAREMIRIWAAGGKQHVSLDPNLWKDPAAWGIMLVDLAKHVANAYELSQGMGRADALARLKAGFDAEWQTATDLPSGKLTD